jgi:hypothetical protein
VILEKNSNIKYLGCFWRRLFCKEFENPLLNM